LEIAFDSLQLRQICESEMAAQRELGSEAAEALKRRLADLRAATSIDDLVAGSPRGLDEGDQGRIGLSLGGAEIVIGPNHTSNPVTGSGEIDWRRVRRVKILRIDRA
jgi:hypothetical protein